MTRDELHLLCVAPEIVIVDLADVALDSLYRALLVQHPALEAVPLPTDSRVHHAARDILLPLHSLRRAVRRYRRVTERLALDLRRDDLPF